MKEVKKIVGVLKGNPYLTYSLVGTGLTVAMLAYVCTQLLIATGTTSLERYRGVESKECTPKTTFVKATLKQYNMDFVNDPEKGNTYADGKLIGNYSANHNHHNLANHS